MTQGQLEPTGRKVVLASCPDSKCRVRLSYSNSGLDRYEDTLTDDEKKICEQIIEENCSPEGIQTTCAANQCGVPHDTSFICRPANFCERGVAASTSKWCKCIPNAKTLDNSGGGVWKCEYSSYTSCTQTSAVSSPTPTQVQPGRCINPSGNNGEWRPCEGNLGQGKNTGRTSYNCVNGSWISRYNDSNCTQSENPGVRPTATPVPPTAVPVSNSSVCSGNPSYENCYNLRIGQSPRGSGCVCTKNGQNARGPLCGCY